MARQDDRPGSISDTAGPVFAILLASLGTSIANVALPQMALAMKAAFPTVQWVVIGYLLALTVLSAGAGRWGDRIGHARALRYGIWLFSVAALAAALAPQIRVLIAARMLQGGGAAVMIVLPMALLLPRARPERLGRAMGMLGSASAVGTAMGPTLGGLLIAGLGWRAVFWLLAGLGGICIALVSRDETPPLQATRKGDLPGAITLALAVAGLALAPTLGLGGIGVAVLALSAAGFWAFWRVEMAAIDPLFPPGAFANAMLCRGLLANALVAAVMMTTLVVGPFYLAIGLGLGSADVGMAMSVGPVLSAASGVPAGRLVDRFGAARMARLGVAAMAVATAVIAGLAPRVGLWGYLVEVAMLTPAYQIFLAANTTQVLAGAEVAQPGMTSGFLGLSHNLGLIMGAAAMAALFAHATGQTDVALADVGQIARGMAVTFGTAAALLAAAVMLLRPAPR